MRLPLEPGWRQQEREVFVMLMNRAETAVINNAARRGLQRFYEAALLARLGGRVRAPG